MGFLNPWFLFGLAAIGLPVYIHLLRRHILPPQPFSSLMFFERGTQSSTRHRRLRYLLLFSLRTALLLLLVLAFANPFIRRAAAGAENKLLLIVVDNSFSMQAGSRFADARQGALQLLASRPQAQKAEVMALGGRLAILTQPIQDAGALRSAVESIRASDSRANLGELAHGVRALAETVHTPIELHLFSDMQKTGMPANFADMSLPPKRDRHSASGWFPHPELDGGKRHRPGASGRPQGPEKVARAGGDCGLRYSIRNQDCFPRGEWQDPRHPQSGGACRRTRHG